MHALIAAGIFWIRELLFSHKHLHIQVNGGRMLDLSFMKNDVLMPLFKISLKREDPEAGKQETGKAEKDAAAEKAPSATDGTIVIDIPEQFNLRYQKICLMRQPAKKLVPDKSTIYVLIYDRSKPRYKLLQRYYKELLNEHIAMGLLAKTDAQVAFNSRDPLDIPSGELTIEVRRHIGMIEAVFQYMAIVVTAYTIYHACRVLVYSYEGFDPLFANFLIDPTGLKKYKECKGEVATNCMICFEDFKGEDEVRVLECMHIFHPSCVDRWLIGHSNRCPYCRRGIDVIERI